MKVEIQKDDLSDGDIARLLNDHLQEMHQYSPPQSIHAIEPEKLKDSSITFWSARLDEKIAGCGALKELCSTSGEIKSMKTDKRYLRKGIGEKILREILAEAKRRAYLHVSLETGTHDAFAPAIAMYKKYGFVKCGPFGNYELDPYSQFFTKELTINR
ncbi:MAG: GNAT family N-acetyltransferase [Pseudomonadota bacterium]